MNLDLYLADLEDRMQAAEERRIIDQWHAFITTGGDPARPVFIPERRPASPSRLDWPEVNINDAILDPTGETMLLGQLCGVNDLITGEIGNIPMIRANYGTTILPTVFGCELYLMERDLNTLPGALALPGGKQAIQHLLKQGIPDIHGGQTRQVLETCQFFIEKLASYPKLNELIRIYHPDWQGPLDICEVVYGSEMFLSFYDDPEMMHDFLALVTDTYIEFADHYFQLFPPPEDFNFHYGWMHRGGIRISLDSCVNFSPEMYREFVLPCDRRLFNRYGGIIHSCGKVDHFVDVLPEIGEGYHGFQLSQPHLNDMEKVFSATVDRGFRIFGLEAATLCKALQAGRNLHGLVHCPSENSLD